MCGVDSPTRTTIQQRHIQNMLEMNVGRDRGSGNGWRNRLSDAVNYLDARQSSVSNHGDSRPCGGRRGSERYAQSQSCKCDRACERRGPGTSRKIEQLCSVRTTMRKRYATEAYS